MSEVKPKKKRYEGLIQFKDALRQTIVCLQASMDTRFAHSLHSPWLKKLDEDHAPQHHLLFATDKGCISDGLAAKDLDENHLLACIHQQQTADLRSEISWNKGLRTKISAWVDPGDMLISSVLFRLISMACNTAIPFDLKDCLSAGGVIKSREWQQFEEGRQFIDECQTQFGLNPQRIKVFKSFLLLSQNLIKDSGKVHLIGDGLAIGILIEGLSLQKDANLLAAALAPLAQGNHTIIVNRPESLHEPLQLAILTAIRMPSQLKGSSSLKGFVFLNNIRPAAILKKPSKLAS